VDRLALRACGAPAFSAALLLLSLAGCADTRGGTIPYNVAIEATMVALLFVRSREANISLLFLLLVLIAVPYWDEGSIPNAIGRQFGQ